MSLQGISLKLASDTVRWVTAPPFELEERRRMSKGDLNNSSALNMSVHSGTHIDAPFHFVAEGLTIDELPLDRFIGPALVFEVDAERYINKKHVESIKLDGATRVLFKTRNSELLHQREYEPDFAAFSVEAAQSLVEQGVDLVGLDYL
ncbi:MAG: cyclase family protein, partial [Dehalococcoidia bacterium]